MSPSTRRALKNRDDESPRLKPQKLGVNQKQERSDGFKEVSDKSFLKIEEPSPKDSGISDEMIEALRSKKKKLSSKENS